MEQDMLSTRERGVLRGRKECVRSEYDNDDIKDRRICVTKWNVRGCKERDVRDIE